MNITIQNITGRRVLNANTGTVTESTTFTRNTSPTSFDGSVGFCSHWSLHQKDFFFASFRYYLGASYFKAGDWGLSKILEAHKAIPQETILTLMGNHINSNDGVKPLNTPTSPANDPASYSQYAAFIANMAKTLPAGIILEIGNEPNKHWKGRGGYFFPDEYGAMLSVAHDAIKSARPDIRIMSGGLYTLLHDTCWTNENGKNIQVPNGLEYIRQLCAYWDRTRGRGKYPLDLMGVHEYFRETDDSKGKAQGPLTWDFMGKLKPRLDAALRLIRVGNANREIWINETGYSQDPKSTFFVEEKTRSLWLRQTLIISLAMGFSRTHLYSYGNMLPGTEWDKNCGLLMNTTIGDPATIHPKSKSLLDIETLVKDLAGYHFLQTDGQKFAFIKGNNVRLINIFDLSFTDYLI